ncbi:MAG: efflux RND transporter periplasmic adaptor subunit [Verrucomicrobia bacterium]|nr:efflux RND transporter periplasmic adaptor subunit [Verrucomicrobiota bacterium]
MLAVLGAGGYFSWQQYQKKKQVAPEPGEIATAVVEARDIRFVINAAGDIGPADQVSVRPEVGGKVAELPVDIGDQVKSNALLCLLDDKELSAERDSRAAEIDGARLQLEKSERTFSRNKQLFTDNLISQEVFDDSRTEYHLATNALERAQRALKTVQEKLSKSILVAPFDCTVLTRPVSLGQTVSGSAGYNSGTEIMTIANLNDMIVNAHINQADVPRLRLQQEVEIQVESVSGLKMTGLLDRIAPQAVIKNGIKGFGARVRINHIDPRIRPGMTAILNIPVAAADNVLAVPLSAVFTEKGERYVYVKKDENYERHPVIVGISDLSYAEVQKGLSEGDIVALELPPQELAAQAKKTGKGPEANGKGAKTNHTEKPLKSGSAVAIKTTSP